MPLISVPPPRTAPALSPTRVAGRGVELALDVGGPKDGAPVVLWPGAGQTRRAWRGTAERLATKGWRVLSIDLRGHGDSQWAADRDYGIDAFVADAEAVLRTLERPAVLVGASIGGIACLLAAAGRAAERVDGLVLVDVVPCMEPQGLQRIRGFMEAHAGGFASVEAAADAVSAYRPDRPRPRNLDGLLHNLRRHDDGRLHWHWDPAFHAGSRAREGMFDRMDSAAVHVTAPTLLISGKRSEVVSRGGARRLVDRMQTARWVDIEEAGHMVVGDGNDRFEAALHEFLDTVADRSGRSLQIPP